MVEDVGFESGEADASSKQEYSKDKARISEGTRSAEVCRFLVYAGSVAVERCVPGSERAQAACRWESPWCADGCLVAVYHSDGDAIGVLVGTDRRISAGICWAGFA